MSASGASTVKRVRRRARRARGRGRSSRRGRRRTTRFSRFVHSGARAAGEQARGLAVDPVGGVHLPVREAEPRGRGEGVRRVARGRVDREPGRLVHDEERAVVVDDAEVERRVRLGLGVLEEREGEPRRDAGRRLEPPPVLALEPVLDEVLHALAREPADLLLQVAVEPPAGVVRLDGEADPDDLRHARRTYHLNARRAALPPSTVHAPAPPPPRRRRRARRGARPRRATCASRSSRSTPRRSSSSRARASPRPSRRTAAKAGFEVVGPAAVEAEARARRARRRSSAAPTTRSASPTKGARLGVDRIVGGWLQQRGDLVPRRARARRREDAASGSAGSSARSRSPRGASRRTSPPPRRRSSRAAQDATGVLRVVTDVPGADVTVDDVAVGTTPLARRSSPGQAQGAGVAARAARTRTRSGWRCRRTASSSTAPGSTGSRRATARTPRRPRGRGPRSSVVKVPTLHPEVAAGRHSRGIVRDRPRRLTQSIASRSLASRFETNHRHHSGPLRRPAVSRQAPRRPGWQTRHRPRRRARAPRARGGRRRGRDGRRADRAGGGAGGRGGDRDGGRADRDRPRGGGGAAAAARAGRGREPARRRAAHRAGGHRDARRGDGARRRDGDARPAARRGRARPRRRS